MVYKLSKFGKFLACPGFPECKNAKPLVTEVKDVLCPLCKGKVIEKKSKKGKIFYGCNNYPKCKEAYWDKPIGKNCPECGSTNIQQLRRVTGYLTGNYTTAFNRGKQDEVKFRVKHK